MSNPATDALMEDFRRVMREELAARDANNNGATQELPTAEDLAAKLKVPKTWVYEQSRQGGIPKVQLGRYIRFDFHAVLSSCATTKALERTNKS